MSGILVAVSGDDAEKQRVRRRQQARRPDNPGSVLGLFSRSDAGKTAAWARWIAASQMYYIH